MYIQADIPESKRLESSRIFFYYHRLCFEKFGDRVKFWITINEPSIVVTHYTRPTDQRYLAAHYLILGHARAWRSYDKDFRGEQKGKVCDVIGFSVINRAYNI